MSTPEVNDIWETVNFGRFVRIVAVDGETVALKTIVKNARGEWHDARNARLTTAKIQRFDGKKNGYSLFIHNGFKDAYHVRRSA